MVINEGERCSLEKQGFLTLIWVVGSFIVAEIVVLFFGGLFG